MEDRIIIDFNALDRITLKLNTAGNQLSAAMNSLAKIHPTNESGAGLRLDGAGLSLKCVSGVVSAASVALAVENYRSALAKISGYSLSLASAVKAANALFSSSEASNGAGVGSIASGDDVSTPMPAPNDTPAGLLERLAALWGGIPFLGAASLLERLFPLTAAGSWSALGWSAQAEASATWDPAGGNIFAGTAGSLEGHLFDANGQLALGDYITAEGSFSALKACVESSAHAAFMKDGKFAPDVGIHGEAGAKVLEGNASSQVGTDDYNIHGSAGGAVLGAEANGTLGFSMTDSGDFEATAEAGLDAYVAKGEISGGFTIFGIKIDGTLSGKALAAGVQAGGSISSTGVTVDLGLSALLGLEGKLSIDWSDFDPPDFSDIHLFGWF